MRFFLMIIAALVVAGGAGYYLVAEQRNGARLAESAPLAVEAPRLREVYVPVDTLSAGSILKPEHLGRLPMEDAALSPEMIVAGTEGEALLVGSVARQLLPRGVPIARSAVVQPGDRGFLAAVLPQGKRAISIPITETAGISGLVLPGDRVDIILTYSIPGDEIDAGRDVRASETVMANIRVLALDQRLNKTAPGAEGRPLGEANPIAKTATLEVTSREAEMVTLATSLGDLSMVLNSVHDGGAAAEKITDAAAAEFTRVTGLPERPRRMTLDSEVTSLLLRRRAAAADAGTAPVALTERPTRIQIVRGTTAGAVELGAQTVGAEAAPGAAEN